MAESTRRGDDAADDRRDDQLIDDTLEPGAVEDDEPVARDSGKAESVDVLTKTKKDTERRGLFAFIGRFFREVVAELRKVIWPTRKELLTYSAVVITFVTVVTAIVVGLDQAFARGVLLVFGNQ